MPYQKEKLKFALASTLIIIITVAVIAVVASLEYHKNIDNPVATPRLLYSHDISPQHLEDVKNVINATQGTAVHINLTLTSECDAQIAIPMENIKLTGYSENITSTWGGSNWDKPPIQDEIFSHSLSLNELTLQPRMSNSTIITISLVDNTPVGRYTIAIDLGFIEFLSEPGENDISYGGGFELYLFVTSNG